MIVSRRRRGAVVLLGLLAGSLALAALLHPPGDESSATRDAATLRAPATPAQPAERDPSVLLARPHGARLTGAGDPAANATAAIAAKRRSLGVSGSAEFRLEPLTRRSDSDAVRFQQVVAGRPIVGAELAVQVDAEGAVRSIAGRTSAIASVGAPTVGAAQAREAALAADASPTSRSVTSEPEPVIVDPKVFDQAGPATPGWRVTLGGPDGAVRVVVDGASGKVVPGLQQAVAVVGALPSAAPAAAGLSRRICDAGASAATETCTVAARVEGQPAVGVADVDQVYARLGETYAYFNTQFGRNSIDGAGKPLVATVRYCGSNLGDCYRWSDWSGQQALFATGVTADDLVARQYTMGVIQYSSDLMFSFQSGAIRESMADVFGELVDQGNGVGTDGAASRWLIGEDLPSGPVRNMADPGLSASPQPDRMTSDRYSGSLDLQNYGAELDSGVGNKAAYLIAEGGTFNGRTISGLGTTKLARLYYNVLTQFLGAASDFEDLGRALPQACAQLVGTAGFTAADCAQVQLAVDATELTQQPIDGSALPDAPLCPSAAQTPTTVWSDDMENARSGNWTRFGFLYQTSFQASWSRLPAYATSGVQSMVGDASDEGPSEARATMVNTVAIPSGQQVFFAFNHVDDFDFQEDGEDPSLDDLYSGGVIEYSADGGAFQDTGAFPMVYGYNGTIVPDDASPIAGRDAFTRGGGGYQRSRIDISALAGKSARFRFRAVNGEQGSGAFWRLDDVKIYTCSSVLSVPGAPTGVSGVRGDGQVTVSWSAAAANGSPVTGYTVTASPGGSTCTWTSGPLSCVVPNLTNGTSYTFTVRATNAVGDGPDSAASTAVVPAGVPGTPPGASATAGNGQAMVSWSAATANGSPVTGYTVTASPGGATCTWSSGPLSCVVSGLTNGTSYTFTVRATNSVGDGPASAATGAVVPAAVPGAPTAVSGVRGDGQVTVSWSAATANGSPVTGYTVTASPGGATCTWSSGPLSCVVSGLTNGTSYTFTVKATNNVGTGPASGASAAVVPGAVPGAPSAVSGVRGDGQVTVSWSAPVSDGGSSITSYKVTASPGGSTCTWSSGPLSCVVSGLTNGTSYTFTVRATNAVGPGPASDASASVVPAALPGAPSSVAGVGGDGQATVSWSAAAANGSPVTGYTVTASPGGSTCTWSSGPLSCVVSGLTNGTSYTFTVLATNGVGDGPASAASAAVVPSAVVGPEYFGLTPKRILDSRDGTGSVKAPWTGGETRSLVVRGGSTTVPASATAVVLNVTAVGPTTTSHVTLWPAGESMPLASNLNLAPGTVRANLVMVKVGSGGQVSIFNNSGNVDILADVVGYYAPDSTGGLFNGLTPKRLLDSRDGTGGLTGPWSGGQARDLTVVGGDTTVPADATAVIMNVTETGATTTSHLTVWPSGTGMPLASNLNFTAGTTVPNLVVVKVGAGGKISIFNNDGNVHVLADVVGYFSPAGGATFTGLTPKRLLDSRDNTGTTGGAWQQGESRAVTVAGGTTTVPANAKAVVLNVTGVNPTTGTHITAWPAGIGMPVASNLNLAAGDVRPNLVVVKVGANGKVSLFNNAGSVDLLADVVGYYTE